METVRLIRAYFIVQLCLIIASLISYSVKSPDSSRALAYDSSGLIVFIAFFCSLCRTSLR